MAYLTSVQYRIFGFMSEKATFNRDDIYKVLSNPIRKKIIISLMNDTLSFSHLMKITNCETGKLSFHLSKIKDYMEQDDLKRYRLKKMPGNCLKNTWEIKIMQYRNHQKNYFPMTV